MLLIPSRNAVVVHIPKTGGMSLSRAVRKAIPDAVWLDAPGWMHATTSQGRGLFHSRVSVLAVIRNPWDIFASYYGWLRRFVADPSALHARIAPYVAEIGHWPFERVLWWATVVHPMVQSGGFWRKYCDEDTEIYRYEDHPWDAIGERLGCRLEMERENESIHEPPEWTDEWVERIGDLCHVDVNRFGYAHVSKNSTPPPSIGIPAAPSTIAG